MSNPADRLAAARLRPRLAALPPTRYRRRLVVEPAPDTAHVRHDGRAFVAFCSNDYLGLASHPAIREALVVATGRYGVGSGAAHLVSGHGAEHHALEEELADFVGLPRALLFSTGYMANLGIASALFEAGDRVYEDRLNHASLLDAGLARGLRFSRYAHADVAALRGKLAKRRAEGAAWVLTDAVFSMEGDVAPLAALAAAAADHGAYLVVDDAHGFGVRGPGGRGSCGAAALGGGEVPVLMGTLGKAAGTSGAFVAGSAELIELLIQRARTYIYTTAMPPAIAAATRVALRVLREEGWRRERLAEHVVRFRAGAAERGLALLPSPTAIQGVVLGSESRALDASGVLRDAGMLVTPIRPPTVPEGGARLRITLSALHEPAEIDALLDALGHAVRGAPAAPPGAGGIPG